MGKGRLNLGAPKCNAARLAGDRVGEGKCAPVPGLSSVVNGRISVVNGRKAGLLCAFSDTRRLLPRLPVAGNSGISL